MSCRAPGQERFTRLKTLGADYTEEAIRERIEGKRARAVKAPRADRGGVNLLIDIENIIKAAQSKGYEHWAKIHNLKQAAKTINFLTEHKIEQYADLVSRIEEVAAESEQAANALRSVEKRLADMAVLMKHVATYQKTKPVYDATVKQRIKRNTAPDMSEILSSMKLRQRHSKRRALQGSPIPPHCKRNMKPSKRRKKPFTSIMAS